MVYEYLDTDARPADARTYWACQFAGWGLYGLAQLYNAIEALHVPAGRALAEIAALNAAAIALTHLLRNFMRRHRWSTMPLRALLPRSLAVSVALGTLLGLAMHFTSIAPMWVLGDEVVLPQIPGFLLDPMFVRTCNWSLAFFFWIAIYFGLTSLRDQHVAMLRQSELTRALQLSELRLLKSQLNPHFLFNSLNSVRALIADDPECAQNAVTQLARTLRYTLRSGQEELVTLERELEIVDDYLALESLRFGDRLRIERRIEASVLGVRIPVMLLQTIVENAIKHGIAHLLEGGTLTISAALHGDTLHIEVKNPRPASEHPASPDGIGVRNSAERLRLLFGARASFELDLSHADLALARISMPRES
ncbi:sensor histidine kinase [Povalibacter uvarum]|nr:histidine kinase [Povalibacter uvarum]